MYKHVAFTVVTLSQKLGAVPGTDSLLDFTPDGSRDVVERNRKPIYYSNSEF